MQSMSEFDGLLKQQNKPACSKSVRVFIMLKLDTIQKKKKKELGQIEAQRDRQTDRRTDRQGHGERERERQTDRQTDRQTQRHRESDT